jgi:hypothetical protein
MMIGSSKFMVRFSFRDLAGVTARPHPDHHTNRLVLKDGTIENLQIDETNEVDFFSKHVNL